MLIGTDAGVVEAASLESALLILATQYNLQRRHFYLVRHSDEAHTVRLRLLGGKGGFGSQLRAQGNKMSSKKRAGNYESCRDLETGARVRTAKQHRLIEEYLKREPERLSQRDREIQEKMQQHLEAPLKKAMFGDAAYLKESRRLVDATEEAVYQGLAALDGTDSDECSDSEGSVALQGADGDDVPSSSLEEDEKAPL